MTQRARAFIFDFGGVIAEEGFREGIKAVARATGRDEDAFFKTAEEVVYGCGYARGYAAEDAFWKAMRLTTGVALTDGEMRKEVMERFVLRSDVLAFVRGLKGKGILTAILSDQTNWIEEINSREGFYSLFDRVFVSYRTHRTKLEPETYAYVCRELGVSPGEALFIDDNPGHLRRASEAGLKTILYRDFESFKEEARQYL